MKAVLFVGHGSRDEEGNEEIRQFVKKMQPKLSEDLLIETCFLEFGKPSIMGGIENCIDKKASDIYLIPIILLPAGHSKIHVPAVIDEAKEKFPNVSFTYGRPIGIHEKTFDILSNRLAEAGIDPTMEHEDTAVLLIGRGGSDPDANSDLYKITRLLWEKLKIKWVETVFMGVTSPSVDEGVERCIKLGAKKVVMLPYFLFTGVLIKRMNDMKERYESEYPENEFILADYFGFHPLLQDIVIDRVEEALQEEVRMNCDTCQYRLDAMEHIDHHHHHDHEHEHHHQHS
ncbi:sirohydrochlorin chelatase [Pueribacillus theae]|uniref:Sirohydrochlorin chelatase n=1 Tax=Pueribacillus theae TaxID=2171751 RepID=A0A2U1K5G3_9BACI|nr:sirohydrochlorin chelatase [Pueribacillus theae]PWA12198.1 sirohydrochlorin chelatase [Pueribacillus theae]